MSTENVAKAVEELNQLEEMLKFVDEYRDGKLAPEIKEAIREVQEEGKAKTVSEAFAVAIEAGWKSKKKVVK